MGQRFDSGKVLALKARYNLADIVRESITNMRNAGGGEWVGTCPFHEGDNTPSFRVNAERYHCFACKKHGDILSWLISTRGLTFKQAIEALGGNSLPDASQIIKPRRLKDHSDYEAREAEKIVAINTAAQEFFIDSLLGLSEPREYLFARLNAEDCRDFGLGYAPMTGFIDHMLAMQWQPEELVQAGLAAIDRYGKHYPRLRDRITIPLTSSTGEILGFAGRIMPRPENEGLPKYVNPPNTHAFNRKRYLYNLYRGTTRTEDGVRPSSAILVEGYFDSMRLASHGVRGVICCLGTGISTEQVAILESMFKRVYIMLDGDTPGLEAAVKSLSLFLDSSLEAHVVLLTDGQDPDTFFNCENAIEIFRSLPRIRLEEFFTAKLTVKMHKKYDRNKLDAAAAPFVDSNIKEGFGHYNVVAWVCAAYPEYAADIRTSYKAMLDNAYELSPGVFGFRDNYIKAFLKAWSKPCREVRKKHAK